MTNSDERFELCTSPWFLRMLAITLGIFEAFTTEIMNMNGCFP